MFLAATWTRFNDFFRRKFYLIWVCMLPLLRVWKLPLQNQSNREPFPPSPVMISSLSEAIDSDCVQSLKAHLDETMNYSYGLVSFKQEERVISIPSSIKKGQCSHLKWQAADPRACFEDTRECPCRFTASTSVGFKIVASYDFDCTNEILKRLQNVSDIKRSNLQPLKFSQT